MNAPKLTDQHRKLEALAGSWCGPERLSSGEDAFGRFDARLGLGGFYLLTDYEQVVAGNVVFRGHGVYGWSCDRQRYTMNWFDTMGETPPALGTWQDNQLIFHNQGENGHARYIYTITDRDSYTLRIEQSRDGQAWRSFLEGSYRRTLRNSTSSR